MDSKHDLKILEAAKKYATTTVEKIKKAAQEAAEKKFKAKNMAAIIDSEDQDKHD